jgi:hypothetical protein
MFTKNARSPYTFASPELFPQNNHGLDTGLSFGTAGTSVVAGKDLNPTSSTPDWFAQLGKCPLSAERQELISRYASVVADITAFLAENRSVRLAALGIAHDEAVATVRELASKLEVANAEQFAAERNYETLDAASKNAGKLVQGARHKFDNADHALHTRKEVAASAAFIEKLRKEATQAQNIAGQALHEYRTKVQAHQEAAKAHQEAVGHATSISRQMNSL